MDRPVRRLSCPKLFAPSMIRTLTHTMAGAFVACALLLRIAVPQGLMPTEDGWYLTFAQMGYPPKSPRFLAMNMPYTTPRALTLMSNVI